MMENGIRVRKDARSVSVTFLSAPMRVAVAEASCMKAEDGLWFVNRVKVPKEEQGKGIGAQIVKKLQEEVAGQGCKVLLLFPGGYGSDPRGLYKFYKKQGFKPAPRFGLGALTWEGD